MIVVIGSINLDLIATTGRLPAPGETVAGKDFNTAAGGKGANQALAALRAGGDMRLFGAVGRDAFADQALAELRSDGADLTGVTAVNGSTGIAVILVGGAGENVIVVIPGANGAVGAERVEAALAGCGAGDILLLQQEVPTATLDKALDMARSKGMRALFNTAPFTDDTAHLAAKADIVIANETEFDALIRTPAGDDRLSAMREVAAANTQTIIVTLGADGALAVTPDGEKLEVPAPDITPVDTVGAGDTFCGYLAAALEKEADLKTALARAVTAGSLACLQPGAQPAIPYKRDVDAALR